MDKKKINKIIAREGLIIIICVVCASLSLFLQNLISYDNPIYSYVAETGGHKYTITSKEFYHSFDFKDKAAIYKALRDEHPNDLGENEEVDSPKPWEKYAILDDLKISYLKTQYTLKDHIKNLLNSLWILSIFAVYPLYLIIRFIIWAIKTLKQKG